MPDFSWLVARSDFVVTAGCAIRIGDTVDILSDMRPSPWRVFLSHTADLRRHPDGWSFIDAAEDAVRAGHVPVDMAYFTAHAKASAALCQAKRAEDRIPQLHRVLLRAHRRGLPTAATGGTSWWEADPDDTYLWNDLTTHLHEAGGEAANELERLVTDLRWVDVRLRHYGATAVDADLALASGILADRLRTRLRHAAHLLQPLTPDHAWTATMLNWLENDSALTPVTRPFAATFAHPRLAAVAGRPDEPDAALVRVLTGAPAPIVQAGCRGRRTSFVTTLVSGRANEVLTRLIGASPPNNGGRNRGG